MGGYPGHMARGLREIAANILLVDLVIEVVDSRAPSSSRGIIELPTQKPRLLVLSKRDVADPIQTQQWCEHYRHAGYATVAVDLLQNKGLSQLRQQLEAFKTRWAQPRFMVIGIPNVGKSSLINRISKTGRTRTGASPGITRGKQWIQAHGLHLLDTPGVLEPTQDYAEHRWKLASIDCLAATNYDAEEVCLRLVEFLQNHYPTSLEKRYGSSAVSAAPFSAVEAIGRSCGCLQSGGRVNLTTTSRRVLQDFRSGRLGPVTLDIWQKEANGGGQ